MTAQIASRRLVPCRAVRARRGRRGRRPLAYARLWHHEQPRTSQRRAIARCAGSVASAILGGNGSGKTDAVAQLVVAVALGRDHPDVDRWLRANGLPAALVPPYPGRVLFSALTSNDSRRVLREKVRRYAPGGCTWRNENGDGEAECRMPASTGNGGVIVFKSNDQGRRGYQADEFDVVVLDEEHDEDVFVECLTRLGRRPWREGYIVTSMTPLKGYTWVYHDFLGKPKPGYVTTPIHGRDNPHADQRLRQRIMAGMSAAMIAARERGEFTVMEGRVYPAFRRDIHVVPAFEPPASWPRLRGIDFGTRNPACVLWVAVDPADDVLHVTREYYRPSTTAELGDAIVAMSKGDPEPEWTVADPENLDARRTLRDSYDIVTEPANKAIEEGLNDVRDLLAVDGDGKPHLVVHDCCPETAREFETYAYPSATGGRAPQENPLKRDDHAMDTIRYVARLHKLRGG